jgi:hypothetical protein
MRHPTRVLSAAFSPDGKRTASSDGTAAVGVSRGWAEGIARRRTRRQKCETARRDDSATFTVRPRSAAIRVKENSTRTGGTTSGFEVVRLKGLACRSPRLIAQVPLADIRAALRELDGNDVDALLQVGTALPTVAVAAEAERWLGKPVLAINTVCYWDAIRRSGIEDRLVGLGRILEEH